MPWQDHDMTEQFFLQTGCFDFLSHKTCLIISLKYFIFTVFSQRYNKYVSTFIAHIRVLFGRYVNKLNT